MTHMLPPRTRRSFLQEGLLASLALVASLGALPIPDVAAGKKAKKKSKSAQSFNQAQKDLCEINGGTLEVNNMGGGRWETTCHGGTSDGQACTNTAKSSVCVRPRTIPDLPTHPLQPESPFANPAQGADQPLQPDGGGDTITADPDRRRT